MFAEASTVLISSLTVGIWRALRITIFGTCQGASTVIGTF
jgi:hypothetical protein